MSAIARPGTPFPHAHTVSHKHSTSTTSYFSPRPIHFTMPILASPTPPSLLKRTSSITSTRAPELLSSRRESSSSSSSGLSVPATPTLGSPVNTVMTPLELPASIACYAPKPQAQASSTAYISSPTPSTSTSIRRPPLKRRDTPRPVSFETLSLQLSPLESPSRSGIPIPRSPSTSTSTLIPTFISTASRLPNFRPQRQRTLTSRIDGGAWVVVE